MRILSFDIEEWFHILDLDSTRTEVQWNRFESRIQANTERILALLEDTGKKATFFCLGWIARKYPEVIRQIHAAGHEVASHSDVHTLVYEQEPQRFADELQKSVSAIEDIIGDKVRAYRAPGFSLTSGETWVVEKLLEAGLSVDCSVFPASRAHGGFPDFGQAGPAIVRCSLGSIREFPMNTMNLFGRPLVFSGGGYFRLLPYWLIRRWTADSAYVMTYFHPRDFDPGQPVIGDLGPIRRFKSYYGLGRAEDKLRRLLNEFDFVDVATAERSIDWDTVPIVQIDDSAVKTPTTASIAE